ncbi:hypothetical protein RRG08_047727 [Elysia crispata]|uniref:Uncharacterized protein n=1 Tax=Elysia crispata TaxID=231223 RepID=A0AAE1DUK0_9GAST|nr:hypothetical protein RRG08_047727 [Elysia crispata]
MTRNRKAMAYSCEAGIRQLLKNSRIVDSRFIQIGTICRTCRKRNGKCPHAVSHARGNCLHPVQNKVSVSVKGKGREAWGCKRREEGRWGGADRPFVNYTAGNRNMLKPGRG